MMKDASQTKTENNRARVRRIVFEPLGFQFKRGFDKEAQERYFAELCDHMAYMSDDRLNVLRNFMIKQGEGARKNQWPDRSLWRVWAEVAQPRPLEDLPCLVTWFSSVEGPAAIQSRTLVETWDYLEQNKVPPAKDSARRLVRERAAENASKLERVEERIALGLPVPPEAQEWAVSYREKEARIAALVEEFQNNKNGAGQ